MNDRDQGPTAAKLEAVAGFVELEFRKPLPEVYFRVLAKDPEFRQVWNNRGWL